MQKEKERIKHKMRKFRKCEEELKAKINEFEEVFNVLT